MKKLAAVLLAAVMAMSLLTACGGGGGGGGGNPNSPEAQLTAAINKKLEQRGGYAVQHSEALDDQLTTLLESLIYENIDTEEDYAAALQQAGLSGEQYKGLYTTVVSSVDSAAGVLATKILSYQQQGKIAKKIGYCPYNDGVNAAIFAVVEF